MEILGLKNNVPIIGSKWVLKSAHPDPTTGRYPESKIFKVVTFVMIYGIKYETGHGFPAESHPDYHGRVVVALQKPHTDPNNYFIPLDNIEKGEMKCIWIPDQPNILPKGKILVRDPEDSRILMLLESARKCNGK